MKKNKSLLFLMACFFVLFFLPHSEMAAKAAPNHLPINPLPARSNFKSIIQGKQVELYILKNKNNTVAAITNYGGRLVSLQIPNKKGVPTDVVLGYDNIKTYQKQNEPYFGAIIGRFGNRIAKGKFVLNSKAYKLDINDGVNTLHGGFSGFYSRVFSAKQINENQLELTLISKDGEGGYPGNLSVKVVYTLTDNNALKIEYTAKTDKSTIVNLTNHSYFNLNGAGSKTISDNLLRINADNFLPVDNALIPTGKYESVKGTPFDFRGFKSIGADINMSDIQLTRGKGYDHNFVLNKHDINQVIATVKSPETGIEMNVYTDQPGLQFYSGNFLTGKTNDGKGKTVYGYRSALCLETQHFPDSPNQPHFPSTVLKPNQTYHTVTIYKFSNK